MEEYTKKYYKISDVSELLGIPQPTLRFWETKFTIINPKRTEKGTRYYSPADIENIRMVNYLVKERGLKIEKAAEIIKHNHKGVSKRYQAIERLKNIRSELLKLMAAIDSGRKLAKSLEQPQQTDSKEQAPSAGEGDEA